MASKSAIVAILLLLAATGCKGKPATPLEEAALRARQEPLVARGDTNALADLALSQCRWLDRESKQTCYENYFVALSDSGRVRLALGALTSLADKDKQVQADGHVYTHIVGIRAWAPGRDVGKVFDSCSGLFQSGCYHGVIQAYFTSDGSVDSTEVSWFCDMMETTRTNRWLRFQCVHGIGHGLEMAWNWDLPRALKEPTSRYNIILQPGDSIEIPEYQPAVKVTGAVNSPGSVLWKEGERLEYYVNAAGGLSYKADKGRVSVRFANGEVRTRHRSLFHLSDPKPGPGSEVMIPEKDMTKGVNWIVLTSAISGIVTSLVALVVLLNQL